jgi:hypothetical protein
MGDAIQCGHPESTFEGNGGYLQVPIGLRK